jgi:hypothetical protein
MITPTMTLDDAIARANVVAAGEVCPNCGNLAGSESDCLECICTVLVHHIRQMQQAANSVPPITEAEAIARLEAFGWEQEGRSIWHHNGMKREALRKPVEKVKRDDQR